MCAGQSNETHTQHRTHQFDIHCRIGAVGPAEWCSCIQCEASREGSKPPADLGRSAAAKLSASSTSEGLPSCRENAGSLSPASLLLLLRQARGTQEPADVL